MRVRSVLGVMFAVLLLGGLAGAENVLTNPSFDSDASGWLLPDNENVTVSHQPGLGSTLPGGSGPGSIEIHLWTKGIGWSGTFQSEVPITGGRDYDFAASVLVPSADNSV